MKFLQHTSKLIFITCLQVIFFVTGYAQVIPKGMTYQAVARNHRGDIFPNQKINLKIYLFSQQGNNRTNHYSELHESTTNDLGYFNLIIGEGVNGRRVGGRLVGSVMLNVMVGDASTVAVIVDFDAQATTITREISCSPAEITSLVLVYITGILPPVAIWWQSRLFP